MSVSNSRVRLFPSINKVTWMRRNNPRARDPAAGWVSGTGVDQVTRVKDLVTVKACGSIHGSDLSFS